VEAQAGKLISIVTPLSPGLPNSLAELNAWYVEPPEGQNAATFFVRGLEAIQITDADLASRDLPIIGKGELPEPGRPLPSKMKAAIAALVQRNSAVLDAFREGMAFGQARYPLDLNRGFNTELPHLGKLKLAAQITQLNALLHAENRQPQAAAESLLIVLAAAESLKDEPLLISQLVRVACLGIAKDTLERVLNTIVLPRADLERLADALATIERELSSGTGFTRCIAGERAIVLAAFDAGDELEQLRTNFEGLPPNYRLNLSIPPLNELTRDLESQRAFAEETFNRALLMRAQPFPERIEVDAHFSSALEAAGTNDFPLCAMLITPWGNKATRREAAGLVTLRRMQTAVALERYRGTNENRYPFSLSELVPVFLEDVPQDPFDGQPLHYARNGDSYELRSVGAEPARSFRIVKAPKQF
jgi:hypothetical protein